MNMDTENNWGGGGVFTAFILGAACGAVAALLTAPQTGAETREQVRDFTRMAGRKARNIPFELQGAWRRAVDAARSAFDDALAQADSGSSYDSGRGNGGNTGRYGGGTYEGGMEKQ
jgi:gas vesicle protein